MNAQFYTAVIVLCFVACWFVSCVRLVLAQASMPFCVCSRTSDFSFLTCARIQTRRVIRKKELRRVICSWLITWSGELCDLLRGVRSGIWFFRCSMRCEAGVISLSLSWSWSWILLEYLFECIALVLTHLILYLSSSISPPALLWSVISHYRSALSLMIFCCAHLICPRLIFDLMNMRFSAHEVGLWSSEFRFWSY